MSDKPIDNLSETSIAEQIARLQVSIKPGNGTEPHSLFEQHPIVLSAEGTVAKPADGEIKETEKFLGLREPEKPSKTKIEDFLATIQKSDDELKAENAELMRKLAELQADLTAEQTKADQARAEAERAEAARDGGC